MKNKKLTRSPVEKMIAGVCGGLAEYFDLDPTVMRLIFVVLTLFGGSGIPLYIILWLVVPVKTVDTAIEIPKPVPEEPEEQEIE